MVTIRELVNFALDAKLIRYDPLEKYKIKKVATKPQPYWVQKELDQVLAAACRQPHHDVFCLLANTGMRIGEVENLLWTDVDFDNRAIHVQPKDDWKPKTGDARSIPMSDIVLELLQRQPRRCR
jgi:integrase